MTIMGTFECDICLNAATATTGNGTTRPNRGTPHGFDTLADLNKHKSVQHNIKEDHAKVVSLSLRPSELAVLDAKRKKASRSDFVRKLIKEA